MISHIFVDVIQQQTLNAEQWGGQAHDDEHRPFDWLRYIDQQIVKAQANMRDGQAEAAVTRARLIKIASLCFDGIASIDRKETRREQHTS